LVLEGRYISTDQGRISYSKYHDIEIGSLSPVKKGKGCLCKKGYGKNCARRKVLDATVDVSAMETVAPKECEGDVGV
jgi:hypothetical protein